MSTKKERLERKKKRIQAQVNAGALVAVGLSLFVAMRPDGTAQETVQETDGQIIASVETKAHAGGYRPTEADKVALAKMVWGEARGCDQTQQAATVWCVLNRFDSDAPYFEGCGTLYDIVTQPGQFVGYDPAHPVDPDIWMMVEDVLARWTAEESCVGEIGRVLPPEYLFFSGDGKANTFTTEWQGGDNWSWNWRSPYEEEI